jgi:hypothetical protein
MALAANHVFASVTLGRGSIDVVACVVMLALVSASTSIGALIGVAVQPRPWWGAPTAVGVCAASSLAVIYIGRGSIVPFVGMLVSDALFVPVFVGRVFARRRGRQANADAA